MNSEMFRAFGAVLGFVAAGPVVWAALKAAMFFGSMEKTVTTLERTCATLETTCKGFAETASNHGERIVAVETRVEGLERRHSDRRSPHAD